MPSSNLIVTLGLTNSVFSSRVITFDPKFHECGVVVNGVVVVPTAQRDSTKA